MTDALFNAEPYIRDVEPLDPTPGAERQRRFQIAHLLVDRNLSDIATDLSVSLRTIERWVISGVTWDAADEIASRVLNMNAEYLFGPEWAEEADAACGPPSLLDELSDL